MSVPLFIRKKGKHPLARAMTLIEILLVVMIISIIVAIAIPQFFSSFALAKLRAGSETLATLRTAEAIYHSKNERYGNFSELADETGIIDRRFAGGGFGPVIIAGNSYVFTVLPTEFVYEITVTTPYGDRAKMDQSGRIIEEMD